MQLFNTKTLVGSYTTVDLDRIHTLSSEKGWNVRELASYPDPVVKESIRRIGQTETACLYKFNADELSDPLRWASLTAFGVKAGDYAPLNFNRRTFLFQQLRAEGAIDPQTVKTDEAGNVIPGSGKVFTKIRAEVLENLTVEEIRHRMDDHATRPLSTVEIFQKFCDYLASSTPNETTVAMRPYWEALPGANPESKAGEDGGVSIEVTVKGADGIDRVHFNLERFLAFRRGVFQNMQRAALSPFVMFEAFKERLRGKQSWPKADEIKKGYDIYAKEKAEDDKAGRCQYNRAKPGPLFMEFWTTLLGKYAIADKTGNKQKAITVMGSDAMTALAAGMQSEIGRFFVFIVQNKIPKPDYTRYDDALLALETGKIDLAGFMSVLKELQAANVARLAAVKTEGEAALAKTAA